MHKKVVTVTGDPNQEITVENWAEFGILIRHQGESTLRQGASDAGVGFEVIRRDGFWSQTIHYRITGKGLRVKAFFDAVEKWCKEYNCN